MATTLVDYSDIPFAPISDEQYRDNLYYQIGNPYLPQDLSIEELEDIIDRPRLPKVYDAEMKKEDILILPDDLQWIIWKTYFSKFVSVQIVSDHKFVWENPSQNLISLCKDVGCIQQGHHCLEEMIEDENMWAYEHCMDIHCDNCKVFGFPCSNLAHYGFQNSAICELWEPNFV